MPLYLLLPLFAGGLISAATVGATDRFIPLVHDGGGWSTEVTVINLSRKPETIVLSFHSPRGAAGQWPLELKVTNGKAAGNIVDAILAPGAVATIETSGTPASLSRGFIELYALGEQPFSAYATLIQRSTQPDDARILQRIPVPLTPAHERRSVLPLDLSNPAAKTELVWVTLTTTTTLDLEFRNLAGELVRTEQVYMDNKAQVFVDLLESFPELKDFRGTMQWTVSFPGADRYEARFLSGIGLVWRDGQAAVSTGMTLAADQATFSPY